MQHEDSAASAPEDHEGYERHFGLAESPFTITPSLRFLFQSASYRAALDELAYALPRREPIVVVTGAIGTGKTTLCRIIANQAGPRTVVATINNPPDTVDDLLRQVLDGFGVLTDDTSQVVQASHFGLLRVLQQFLASLGPLNAQAIIIFDEAQHLKPEMLEQIRLLSNEGPDNQVLQIILVGQPELDELLSRDDLRQVNQRISRRHRLEPLQAGEVSAYVGRRLNVAQIDHRTRDLPEFTASAMRAIATLSRGVPRVINTLCDRALESAWAEQTRTIDTGTVVHAARFLNIDVPRTIQVRVKRRYAQAAVAATLVLCAVLLWTVRDSAISRWARRQAVQPEAVHATGPASPRSEAIAATTPTPAPVSAPAPAPAPIRASTAAPTPPPAAVAAAPPETQTPARETTAADRFLIVVSSFRTRDTATKVAADIAALGLPAFVRSASDWQQVVVGPYASREEASAAQSRLATAHIADTTITQDGPRITQDAPRAAARPAAAAPLAAIRDAPLDELLGRTSALARQSNVKGLQQIRDEIVRRQEAGRGATDAGAFASALDQLDRDIDQARRRQLEEDGRRLGLKP